MRRGCADWKAPKKPTVEVVLGMSYQPSFKVSRGEFMEEWCLWWPNREEDIIYLFSARVSSLFLLLPPLTTSHHQLFHNQNFGNWLCGHEVQGDWIKAMVTAAIICTSYQRSAHCAPASKWASTEWGSTFCPSESANPPRPPTRSNQQPSAEGCAPRPSRLVISLPGHRLSIAPSVRDRHS